MIATEQIELFSDTDEIVDASIETAASKQQVQQEHAQRDNEFLLLSLWYLCFKKILSTISFLGTNFTETLQQVPAKQLAQQQRKALGQHAEKQSDLVFIFLPVVEQHLTEHSIITKPPEELLKSYDTLRTPLLEGCNDAEGILGLYILRRKTRGEDIRHLPGRLASKLFPCFELRWTNE